MSSPLNLHQELKRGSFDFALLATYEFDTPFFESFALSHFDALAGCNDIVVFLDRAKHAEMLNGQGSSRPRRAGLRYIPTPVGCAGVFHPKVYLLASRDRGLLLIGSANLTRAGLSRNAELVGSWRYDRSKPEKHLGLFQDAFEFLADVASRWPSPSVSAIMQDVRRECDWLVPGDGRRDGVRKGVRLIHNLAVPLWPQLLAAAGDAPRRLSVVSPYFDSEPTILDQLEPGLGRAKVSIHTERRRTTMTRRWLEHPLVRSGRVTVSVASYGDGRKPQPLHGKALAIASRSETLLAYGSANFTRPALLHASDRGNIETLVLVPGLPANFNVTELFDPLGTAVAPTPDELCEENQHTVSMVVSHDFRLIEARIEDGRLVVVVAQPPEGKVLKWTAEVIVAGWVPILVRLRLAEGGVLIGTPDDEMLQLCATEATTVRVAATYSDGHTATSGFGFLVNLRDAPTGARRRLERRVREAEQSAERFAEVLSELLISADEAALIRFLRVCNIRLVGAELRRGDGRPVRDPWQPGALRVLGDRNVRHFLSVHEAALDFIDRHIRRLQRHATSPAISGIPSVMHVTRSVVEVIRAQLVRLIIGLELTTSPLEAEIWGKCRENASLYLVKTQDLFSAISNYIDKIKRGCGREKTRLALEPDVSPLRGIVDEILGIRERLGDCRLRVRTSVGIVPAPYFDRDLLGEHRFDMWASGVRSSVGVLSC